MKQRFSNSSCFMDHDASTVITFLQRETSVQKIYLIFFEFVNISPISFITYSYYCKIKFAVT